MFRFFLVIYKTSLTKFFFVKTSLNTYGEEKGKIFLRINGSNVNDFSGFPSFYRNTINTLTRTQETPLVNFYKYEAQSSTRINLLFTQFLDNWMFTNSQQVYLNMDMTYNTLKLPKYTKLYDILNFFVVQATATEKPIKTTFDHVIIGALV
ncbi:hypothetical protein RCL_jg19716.t1 [Rhizophagus clarus]|uniref:Uncharacterized protein n=1 Tax=Rhizophagus clarus TaxID=94130 RepID=A0A8H3R2B9_9GLOM|nr:hypothetical protein RCL_jg19716.t1 [Rhizophagus clarus]